MRPPRQLKASELSNQIEKLLSKNTNTSFTSIQISRKINVANPPGAIILVLKELVNENKVLQVGIDHYKWAQKGHIPFNGSTKEKASTSKLNEIELIGKVDMTRTGDAYITDTTHNDDIFVPAKYLRSAMDKDIVKVVIETSRSRRRPEGKVVSVEKRALSRMLGIFREFENVGIVIPDDNRFVQEIIIFSGQAADAKDGDRVAVEITDWGKGPKLQLKGKIVGVLENISEHESKMQGILLSNGFDIEFPPEVMAEVDTINGQITDIELAKRRDMRQVLTITIDPLTAKDFDDAISCRVLENGHTEIGVHIADVTHFLHEGTALDHEAFRRSTSVYLVDRVCPMLPHKLSNDLCSLNPHEDKYTFSAIFDFDSDKKIVNEWYGKTIIHSDRRYAYEEAQERLETGEGDYAKEIHTLNEFALALREARFNEGSLSFESEEVQFLLDENNMPTGLYVRERKAAHMLIEDFMLLANKRVATYIFNKAKPEIPAIYRIHDLPNPDKLADFALFAKELGFQFRFDTPKQIAESFNRLGREVETNPLLKILEPLAIRTMAKAVYSTKNIGHYGLGFEFYTHFTSPIRRYADVLVHRTLFKNLSENIVREDQELLEDKAKHISAMERKANDAERESIKYMQTVYISAFIGQTFDGVISGMIEKGIFVELLESKVEGFVPFDTMSEIYAIHSTKLKAVSRISGSELKMGQAVQVKVIAADLGTSRTEMMLLEN